MTGKTFSRCLRSLAIVALLSPLFAYAEPKTDSAANTAAQTKAVFQAKLNDVKAAYRDIEKLQADYQSADASSRNKINNQLSAQVAHAQTLVNAMVDAAKAAYRAGPNADPEVTNLLVSVTRYQTIGRQIGRGQHSQRNPEDVYYLIDGGDQYERALPIIKMLIDGGANVKELYVWGFLCAFMTNDYDLAKNYLAKVKETGALQPIADSAGKSEQADPEAGLMKNVLRNISMCFKLLDEYRELWKKESDIRAAEAKADNLPRVKLTTTKGAITIELFEKEAPESVANFLTLVKQGFYNGSPFHRVLPQFMAQGGAKNDDGTGGPGYNIRDEVNKPDYRRHFRGSLSMANTGQPNTGSSQFFLTFIPTAHLNGRHTVFGRVIEGMEVIGDLQHRSPEHERDPPKPDRILKAEVIRDSSQEAKFERLPER